MQIPQLCQIQHSTFCAVGKYQQLRCQTAGLCLLPSLSSQGDGIWKCDCVDFRRALAHPLYLPAWNSLWSVKCMLLTRCLLVLRRLIYPPSLYPSPQNDANQPRPILCCRYRDNSGTTNQHPCRGRMLHAVCRPLLSINIMKKEKKRRSTVTPKSMKVSRWSAPGACTQHTHVFSPLVKHVSIMSLCL